MDRVTSDKEIWDSGYADCWQGTMDGLIENRKIVDMQILDRGTWGLVDCGR